MTNEGSSKGGMLARVVVGYDGTEPSLKALTDVADLVGASGGEVIAVFVRHVPVFAEPGAGEAIVVVEESLDELAKETQAEVEEMLGARVAHRFVVRDGDPASELLAAARELGATMVAVGATIHGQIASLFVSSVAEHLLHHCELPLLVVRPAPAAT